MRDVKQRDKLAKAVAIQMPTMSYILVIIIIVLQLTRAQRGKEQGMVKSRPSKNSGATTDQHCHSAFK